MSEAFVAHIETLTPGTPEAGRLVAAASSTASLTAYADEHGLELSPDVAEWLVATSSRQLDDTEIDGVSGGRLQTEEDTQRWKTLLLARLEELGITKYRERIENF